MRKVIGIGETVLDIIFKDNKPVEAVPGGSTFNAIISLGRCGVNASFISEAGNDRVGDYIIKFLRRMGLMQIMLAPSQTQSLQCHWHSLIPRMMQNTSFIRTILTTN